MRSSAAPNDSASTTDPSVDASSVITTCGLDGQDGVELGSDLVHRRRESIGGDLVEDPVELSLVSGQHPVVAEDRCVDPALGTAGEPGTVDDLEDTVEVARLEHVVGVPRLEVPPKAEFGASYHRIADEEGLVAVVAVLEQAHQREPTQILIEVETLVQRTGEVVTVVGLGELDERLVLVEGQVGPAIGRPLDLGHLHAPVEAATDHGRCGRMVLGEIVGPLDQQVHPAIDVCDDEIDERHAQVRQPERLEQAEGRERSEVSLVEAQRQQRELRGLPSVDERNRNALGQRDRVALALTVECRLPADLHLGGHREPRGDLERGTDRSSISIGATLVEDALLVVGEVEAQRRHGRSSGDR